MSVEFLFMTRTGALVTLLLLMGGVACGDKNPPSTPTCAAGTEGCQCDDGECSEDLTCDRGYCVPAEDSPDCQDGALGCPCAEGGLCEDGARCNDANQCEPSDCTAGAEGCACASPGDTCEGALACIDGLCRSALGLAILIGDEAVRACDMVIEEKERPIVGVSFGPQVDGRFRQAGPRTAISWVARNNAPIEERAFDVLFVGDDPLSPDAISIALSECFDSTGASVSNPQISLGE